MTASDTLLTNDMQGVVAEEGHSFVFFSALLNKPVCDSQGAWVGQLTDLAVSVAYMFPPVVGFVVQRGHWEPFALTGRWSDVVDIEGPAIRLGVPIHVLKPSKMD